MRRHATSYAFLMEMLWVCGWLAVSAAIFVLAFGKAESQSRKAENLNHAVLAAQNALEYRFAAGTAAWLSEDDGHSELNEYYFFQTDWQPAVTATGSGFCLRLSSKNTKGLLSVSALVSDPGGEIIYRLEGAQHLHPPSAAERSVP